MDGECAAKGDEACTAGGDAACPEVDPPIVKRTFSLHGVSFEVDPRYTVVRRLGAGSFGTVCQARDEATGEMVAIKRVANAFENLGACRKALREVRMLRHLDGHENIIGLRDVMRPPDGEWRDLYLVTDFMDVDLNYIIHSRQPLSHGHVQWFIYQLMRGLKAIHSAHAIHRDIKPSNLLVNKNCDLKIADFGLARAVGEEEGEAFHLTEYVVTRWYRSPELIAQSPTYDAAVDMWAGGCILAECLTRQVLLKGKDYLHQLRLILQLLGTPSDADLASLQSPPAIDYIRALPRSQPTPLPTVFPRAPPEALDLLSALLTFDPKCRLSAGGALEHPFLREIHELNESPDAPPFDFAALRAQEAGSLEELRAQIWQETEAFHPDLGPAPPSSFSESPARVMELCL
jgi:serine/threonine protein kinase